MPVSSSTVILHLDAPETQSLSSRFSEFAEARPAAVYGEGTGQVLLSRLQCTGTETDMGLCPSAGFRNIDGTACNGHANDVGVNCPNVRYVPGNGLN